MSSKSANVTYNFRRTRAVRSTGIELLRLPDGEQASPATPMAPHEGSTTATGKVPRVTRLLALAHKFEDMLASGEVGSMAELSRAGRVSRARLSQIMDLVLLAPDIQDEIMGFIRVTMGSRDPVVMREVQIVVRSLYWPDQRVAWQKLLALRGFLPMESLAP